MIMHSGSAIPVLILMQMLLKPKKVLELGAGEYSTPIFTNRDLYPNLIQFDSFENGSAAYQQKCRDMFSPDSDVYKLHLFGPPKKFMAKIVHDTNTTIYDLILVDDSGDQVGRAQTVRFATAGAGPNSVLLIHDFENPNYSGAVQGDFTKFVFKSIFPYVGVLWKERAISLTALQVANDLIGKHFEKIKLDVSLWRRIFEPLVGE